jgi:hypothetical protein
MRRLALVVALVVVVVVIRLAAAAVAVMVVVVLARSFVSGGHRRRSAFAQTRRDIARGFATRSRRGAGALSERKSPPSRPSKGRSFCKWPDESERVEDSTLHVKSVEAEHELLAVLRASRVSRSRRSWRRGSS